MNSTNIDPITADYPHTHSVMEFEAMNSGAKHENYVLLYLSLAAFTTSPLSHISVRAALFEIT